MIMAMGPVKTWAELQLSVSSNALLFLDLPGSLHTQDRVPKLKEAEKIGRLASNANISPWLM